jgi:hypothetical protein
LQRHHLQRELAAADDKAPLLTRGSRRSCCVLTWTGRLAGCARVQHP